MSTKPYELLARFRPDGTVSGVSVRTITTISGRDYEGDPTPLAGATDPAFTAFAADFAAAAVAERDAAIAERDTARASLATVTAERDAARSEVTRLTAELDAIRNPTDQQGFPILTAVQLRLGILGAGLSLADIDAAIAAIPDAVGRARVETYWQYATQFERSHPLMAGMIQMIGLSSEQADAIWMSAGDI
jgi:hypothetical protein